MSAAAQAVPKPVGAEVPRYVVEVGMKPGNPDPAALALQSQLSSVGVASVTEVRVLALYELRGRMTAAQATLAARDLLADPVTQDYRLDRQAAAPLPAHWRLEVWLKSSMTDPVGESVRKAVKDLNLPEPATVRTGAAYQLFGRLQKSQADRVLERLLSNPVIHRVTAELR
ncbi:MAG: phosphoribosylformylglycinamidine synthase subunit PurS [Elusimicrobia bacterium]|nr:phosphoribosylformylglycinamidine synthase subunit PurS [Elusimicrobiota bacterium]